MSWNSADFHPLVFPVLEASSGRPVALSASDFQPKDLPPTLVSADPKQLFPHARDAHAALSGLALMAGHWELSHQVAQDISSREGSYWHAIAHRTEPDSANAGYWFRRVGEHPIFAALHEQASALLVEAKVDWRMKTGWDPHRFLAFCDENRTAPGSANYECAQRIQTAECELLFSWCALNR